MATRKLLSASKTVTEALARLTAARAKDYSFAAGFIEGDGSVSVLNIESREFDEHLGLDQAETISSQAVEEIGSTEGVTATGVSSNNNPWQERATSTQIAG